MDKAFIAKVKEATPKFNPEICNGLAKSAMEDMMAAIDQLMKSLDFPPEVVYKKKIRVVNPEQFLRQYVNRRPSKISFEISKQTIYLVALEFEVQGEKMDPVYLYLPYSEDGGYFKIKDNTFVNRPVLSDETFSYSNGTIFTRFNRARITVSKLIHFYNFNGKRRAGYVTWSWIHHEARKRLSRKSATAKIMYSTLANYIFAEYGLEESFKLFADVDVKVGHYNEISSQTYGKTHNIYSSTGIRPQSVPRDETYVPNPYRIAIPKSNNNEMASILAISFIYLMDRYHNVVIDDIETAKSEFNNTETWKIILAKILMVKGTHVSLALEQLNSHISSLREYVDTPAKKTFKSMGLKMETIYDVFKHIMLMLNKTIVTDVSSLADVSNKRLEVLPYTLYEVINSANMLMYTLINIKNKNGTITPDDFKNAVRNNFMPLRALSLGNPAIHPQVDSVDNTPVSYLFTSLEMVPQKIASNRSSGKKKTNLSDPSTHAHSSLFNVCSPSFMPKSDPTGRLRLSPYLQLEDGTTPLPNKYNDILERTQRLLDLRIKNPSIEDED